MDRVDEAGQSAEVIWHLPNYHDTRSILTGSPQALFASTRVQTPTISSSLWVGIMLYRT